VRRVFSSICVRWISAKVWSKRCRGARRDPEEVAPRFVETLAPFAQAIRVGAVEVRAAFIAMSMNRMVMVVTRSTATISERSLISWAEIPNSAAALTVMIL
jgi:hypothetical protein